MSDRIVDLQTRIDADWQAGLAKRGQQATIPGNEFNVLQALRTAPELRALVQFDEFALSIEFTRSPPWRHAESGDRWTDDDDVALMGWLQDNGIAIRGKNVAADCVALVGKDRCVHPVRQYLESLRWDGRQRLDSWLGDYLGAEGDGVYLSAVGRCWLISAVARIMKPGAKADCALVLESPQGVQKSTTAAMLAIRPEWFCDSLGDLHNKDSAIQLCGKWIIELAELAAVRGSSRVEAVKAYLSRTHDVYRPPYGRRAVTIPRQCVFIGTTNERQYLRDRTGNRRFWPVRCTAIDLPAFERDRNMLWAEAVHEYRAGTQWWLTTDVELLASQAQDDRLYQSEIDAMVAEYLSRRADDGVTEVTTRDVFVGALGFDANSERYADQTKKLGTDVATAIEAAGWHRVGTKGRGAAKRKIYKLTQAHLGNSPTIARARIDVEEPEKSWVNLGECPDCSGRGCDEILPRPDQLAHTAQPSTAESEERRGVCACAAVRGGIDTPGDNGDSDPATPPPRRRVKI